MNRPIKRHFGRTRFRVARDVSIGVGPRYIATRPPSPLVWEHCDRAGSGSCDRLSHDPVYTFALRGAALVHASPHARIKDCAVGSFDDDMPSIRGRLINPGSCAFIIATRAQLAREPRRKVIAITPTA